MKFSALVVTTASIIAITNVRIAAGAFYCKTLKTQDTCNQDQRCEWFDWSRDCMPVDSYCETFKDLNECYKADCAKDPISNQCTSKFSARK
ncbi:hypothetical protein LRAMOSA09437 [Lichtheimia ramosa]|uniref:Extracellular membrane protein CFEM domain-containing protein n=1 Tax=Lichtheimia ramosa TaxID=688394 RepID=A0A077WIB7_9FUNG|nr:hypothetical protein LRAMOSA09437 [Lichtheimia ramosa]